VPATAPRGHSHAAVPLRVPTPAAATRPLRRAAAAMEPRPPPPEAAHTTVVIHPCSSDVSLAFSEHDAMKNAAAAAAAASAAAAAPSAAAAQKAHLLRLLSQPSGRGRPAVTAAAAALPAALQVERRGPTFLARSVISFVALLAVAALFAVLTIILVSNG
jgi:hypothetical protein